MTNNGVMFIIEFVSRCKNNDNYVRISMCENHGADDSRLRLYQRARALSTTRCEEETRERPA